MKSPASPKDEVKGTKEEWYYTMHLPVNGEFSRPWRYGPYPEGMAVVLYLRACRALNLSPPQGIVDQARELRGRIQAT